MFPNAVFPMLRTRGEAFAGSTLKVVYVGTYVCMSYTDIFKNSLFNPDLIELVLDRINLII